MSSEQKLVEAIQKDDLKELTQLIENNQRHNLTDANYCQEYPKPNGGSSLLPTENLTLIHIAAIYDSFECFIFLEDRGFSLRAKSAESYLPLHYACLFGSYEVASYILDKDPTQAEMLPPGLTHHFLYLATVGGDPEILEELFTNGANMIKRENSIDDPISKAIACGSIPCLKILLNHGKATTTDDMTAPMKAVINNRHDAVLLLVESVSDIIYFSRAGQSLIQLCCFYGIKFKEPLLKIIQMVGRECIEPPIVIQMEGVCHWICMMCDLEVAEALLRTGGVIINRLDSNDSPGPFKMIDKKNLSEKTIVSILALLIQYGFDVNIRKPYEKVPQTPTILEKFVSAMVKNYEVIAFLLDNGADPDALCAKSSITLYDSVKSKSDRRMKEIFAAHLHR